MKKNTKIVIVSILSLALLLILTKGVSYAKYVSNSAWKYYLESNKFYISSDYLGETSINNVNNNWNGESIYFNIKNSENDELITDYDINYNVTCSTNNPNVNCKLNATNSTVLRNKKKCINLKDENDVSSLNKTDCEIGGYSWKSIESINELYFNLESNEEITSEIVTVTITSTSPYKKILTGKFILNKDKSTNENIDVNLNNYADYDRLILTNNYITNKCISVTWDSSKLLIDTPLLDIKNSEVDSNNYINKIILELTGKNERSFKFYKLDNIIHSKEEFIIVGVDC